MERKLVLVLVAFTLLMPLCSPVVNAEETRWVWGFTYEGLSLDIYSPYQGKAGDTIAIRVRAEAKEDIHGVTVYVQLRGSKNYGYGQWIYGWYHLSDIDLSSGVERDKTYNITIPSDVDSGLIYGYVECKWKVNRPIIPLIPNWVDRSYEGSFNVAYLTNLLNERNYWINEYNSLLSEYNSYKAAHSYTNSEYDDMVNQRNHWISEYQALNSSFNDYKKTHSYTNSEYDDLASKYEGSTSELGTSRNLNFVLIVTTIVFVATTAFFIMRKPKPKPKIETK